MFRNKLNRFSRGRIHPNNLIQNKFFEHPNLFQMLQKKRFFHDHQVDPIKRSLPVNKCLSILYFHLYFYLHFYSCLYINCLFVYLYFHFYFYLHFYSCLYVNCLFVHSYLHLQLYFYLHFCYCLYINCVSLLVFSFAF